MNDSQLALIPPAPPKLTDRQQALLDAVVAAGTEGLTTGEGGAVLHALKEESRWAHTRDERCRYCAKDGATYLRRLRTLGHVRYRGALKIWVALETRDADALLPGMTDKIPY